ncbi:MAG: hypothetical protein H6833_07755 [Planctomycetes bacterium]|nr:hypothetical protein [Planctomycetota bacterium]
MAIEHALEAQDPARKLARRRKHQAMKAVAEQVSGAGPASASPRPDEDASTNDTKIALQVSRTKAFSRYVSSEVRELVFERANLRCFCGVHHRWVAEQVYGEAFMRAKIEEAGRKRAEVRGRVHVEQVKLTGR